MRDPGNEVGIRFGNLILKGSVDRLKTRGVATSTHVRT